MGDERAWRRTCRRSRVTRKGLRCDSEKSRDSERDGLATDLPTKPRSTHSRSIRRRHSRPHLPTRPPHPAASSPAAPPPLRPGPPHDPGPRATPHRVPTHTPQGHAVGRGRAKNATQKSGSNVNEDAIVFARFSIAFQRIIAFETSKFFRNFWPNIFFGPSAAADTAR